MVSDVDLDDLDDINAAIRVCEMLRNYLYDLRDKSREAESGYSDMHQQILAARKDASEVKLDYNHLKRHNLFLEKKIEELEAKLENLTPPNL